MRPQYPHTYRFNLSRFLFFFALVAGLEVCEGLIEVTGCVDYYSCAPVIFAQQNIPYWAASDLSTTLSLASGQQVYDTAGNSYAPTSDLSIVAQLADDNSLFHIQYPLTYNVSRQVTLISSGPSSSVTSASTLCGGAYYDFTIQTAAQPYWALSSDVSSTFFTLALEVSGAAGTSYAALSSLSNISSTAQGPGILFMGQLVNGSVAVKDFRSHWLLISSASPYSEGYIIPSGSANPVAIYTGNLNLATCAGCSQTPQACPTTVGSASYTLQPAQTMSSMLSSGLQTCAFLPQPLSFASSLPFPDASQQSVTCNVSGSYLQLSITVDNAYWGVQRLYDDYVTTVAIQSLSSSWIAGNTSGSITLQVENADLDNSWVLEFQPTQCCFTDDPTCSGLTATTSSSVLLAPGNSTMLLSNLTAAAPAANITAGTCLGNVLQNGTVQVQLTVPFQITPVPGPASPAAKVLYAHSMSLVLSIAAMASLPSSGINTLITSMTYRLADLATTAISDLSSTPIIIFFFHGSGHNGCICQLLIHLHYSFEYVKQQHR
ncbi:hypothetical protein WJX84_007900 [Apatococcus fuscideae]|uniref:Uncharacterized protein n=1 Tax=Apatococcus fuscideae TaxID=2026836 RepID=A0AAW1TF01_9CHLO